MYQAMPMNRRIVAPALLLMLALAGCLSDDERRAQAQAQWVADQQECANLGFEPGTDPFADCLLRLREIRAQERGATGGLGLGVGVGIGL